MQDNSARQEWMGLLAKSPAAAVTSFAKHLEPRPQFQWMRRPEIGTVMTRGRINASGPLFNLGEITVTRCSVQLEDGTVGHGYVQGRDKTHAETAALIDAMMQSSDAARIDKKILCPLRQLAKQKKAEIQARADKTKVDFFTLVRGDD